MAQTEYTYDTLNRLLTVSEPNGRVTTYTYDDAGNRATETIVVGTDTTLNTYTYNSQNRLISIEEKLNDVVQNVYDYAYDNNGNELTKTRTPYENGVPQTPVIDVTNSYDAFNQLIQSVNDTTTSTYEYNGEGLRVSKTVDSDVTLYLYQYSLVILETDEYGDETAHNVYGVNLLVREADGAVLLLLLQRACGRHRADEYNHRQYRRKLLLRPLWKYTCIHGNFG